MGFAMGLLERYVMFTVAVFVVGGVMGWFLDEESIIDNTPLYNFLKEMPYEAIWCIISLQTGVDNSENR